MPSNLSKQGLHLSANNLLTTCCSSLEQHWAAYVLFSSAVFTFIAMNQHIQQYQSQHVATLINHEPSYSPAYNIY